jgi:DNA-directed RNA polymerase subunit RPC12/RpoP
MKEEKDSKYICGTCGKEVAVLAEESKWTVWVNCPDCNSRAYDPSYTSTSITFIAGYNSEGYNEGLDTYIRDKKHYQSVLKEKNFREAG